MQKYESSPGEHISTACENAIALAKQSGNAVEFNFNDETIIANPDSTADALVALWDRHQKESREAYRQTPAYRESQKQLKREIAQAQATTDADIARLPAVLATGDVAQLVAWFASFGEAADWRDVTYDRAALIKTLEGAGYVEGQFVGAREAIERDSHIKARYLVGQFLSGMKGEHGCWPQILTHWCKEFPNND